MCPLDLTLSLSPMVGLPLLAVIKQKSERTSKADNDQTLRNAVIYIFKEAVAARYGFGRRWLGEVIITVMGMIIRMWVFKELGDPFTERPIFARIYS